MQWYYCDDLSGAEAILSAEEAHHLVHVIRLQVGDKVLLTDGKGTLAEATILRSNARECRLEISVRESVEAPDEILHLAFAPTKNIDRTEWMLEKATEMGVQILTPLRSRFSERKDVNPQRLQKIITAAAKQSRRAWFPELRPLQQFQEFIAHIQGPAFLAHCNEKYERCTWTDYLKIKGHRTILIGPEGDFSAEEIEQAMAAGIAGISLGNRRLRSETAAMAVCLPLLLESGSKSA